MEIKTQKFRLDKQRYFFIVMRKHLRKRIWFFLVIWAFAIALAFIKMNFITIILIIYALVYPSLVLYFLKKRFNQNTNPDIFRNRYFVLKGDSLITHFEDETSSVVKLKEIRKIYKKRKYSMAYVDKNQFVYIPKEAFLTKSEYDSFILKLVQ